MGYYSLSPFALSPQNKSEKSKYADYANTNTRTNCLLSRPSMKEDCQRKGLPWLTTGCAEQ